jgi:Zn-dependent protease with chaperone function/uncharacterized RDD family membrane protein YckC
MVKAPGAPGESAFDGPHSLRVRNEWRVLIWCTIIIVLTAPLLAYLFPTVGSLKELALLVIGAMIYVTFARGRLIGGSIRVHAGQFGHVYEIAVECSRALRMTVPNVFVRDDPFVPIVAVGIGEPYSLIISAQWVDHLAPGELRFLIGRELAHIDAGHARVTSLLSVNGRENAIISILFGAWLRRIEYTADRAGLLCCASLDDALAAISVSTFHLVGRKIDLAAFAEQQREIEAERTLRVGEWIASTPYATKRIAALRQFARDPLFLQWSARFERDRSIPTESRSPAPGGPTRRTFANFPRRLAALSIDWIVVNAIVPDPPFATISPGPADAPAWLIALGKHLTTFHAIEVGGWSGLLLFAYFVVLVGLTGQSFGMMIMDLRVVTDRFTRIGVVRAMVRYVCLIASFLGVIGVLRIFGRVQPFEKWSRTRLIAGTARRREAAMVQPVEVASS